jgi:hypothetical protein
MTVVGRLSGVDQFCHVLATSKKTDKIASESPWGYMNTCTPCDLRGVQVFLFPVIAPDYI